MAFLSFNEFIQNKLDPDQKQKDIIRKIAASPVLGYQGSNLDDVVNQYRYIYKQLSDHGDVAGATFPERIVNIIRRGALRGLLPKLPETIDRNRFQQN